MNVKIIGAPMDLGASRRGTDMGPSALRVARLGPRIERLGHHVEDLGNVYSPTVETKTAKNTSLLYAEEILRVCDTLARRVEKVVAAGDFPLVLGGDHSVAMGTVGGVARVHGPGRTGILWVDAHGDFNTTDTSPTGNIHGMPLAAICGLGDPKLTNLAEVNPKVRPENAVIVGARDVDPEEAQLIKKAGVTVFTMRELDERGVRRVMEDALDIACRNVSHLHVSFDADSVDPEEAPGVGTPVPGGLTFREAHLAMEMVAEVPYFRSLEIVEVNPLMDERNRTGELMVGLAASALGKRIL
ncbi:MAG TPA: arginase [Candidatus Thermoplasmatota archaeon]|nr:arginase [Candidatus Thermoplasmatota archaeon]